MQSRKKEQQGPAWVSGGQKAEGVLSGHLGKLGASSFPVGLGKFSEGSGSFCFHLLTLSLTLCTLGSFHPTPAYCSELPSKMMSWAA